MQMGTIAGIVSLPLAATALPEFESEQLWGFQIQSPM